MTTPQYLVQHAPISLLFGDAEQLVHTGTDHEISVAVVTELVRKTGLAYLRCYTIESDGVQTITRQTIYRYTTDAPAVVVCKSTDTTEDRT